LFVIRRPAWMGSAPVPAMLKARVKKSGAAEDD
jgi:hypothetical protein